MDLEEKVVVVTGGARGIGRGIAEAFVSAGSRVVLADLGRQASTAGTAWSYALADDDTLSAAAEEIDAMAVEVDVASDASCRQLAATVREQYGRIDVLVNNAGVVHQGPILEYSEETWDRTFDVNVKGIFLMVRACVPEMTSGGAIINLASIAGKRGYPGMAAYCASKFAVVGLTQSLAGELAPQGIRVNAICPGVVNSSMWFDHLSVSESLAEQMQAAPGDEAFQAFVEARIPLGREQTAADMGQAAVYLASADNVAGVSLNVAGGLEMI